MKRWLFLVAVLTVGCGDTTTTQTVEVCTEEAADPFVEGEGGMGGGGSGGAGGSGGSALLGDGASCDDDAQCNSAFCIPSANSFGSGVCFSTAMEGCVVVTDPSPFKAQCALQSKRLYACGNYDVSLLGDCTDVGTGNVGEHYQCCTKPGFP